MISNSQKTILILGLALLTTIGLSILIHQHKGMPKDKKNKLLSLSGCITEHKKTFSLPEQSLDEIRTLAQTTQEKLSQIQNMIEEENIIIDSKMWESTFDTIEFDKLLERKDFLLKKEASLKFSFYRAIKKIISKSNVTVQDINGICL